MPKYTAVCVCSFLDINEHIHTRTIFLKTEYEKCINFTEKDFFFVFIVQNTSIYVLCRNIPNAGTSTCTYVQYVHVFIDISLPIMELTYHHFIHVKPFQAQEYK